MNAMRHPTSSEPPSQYPAVRVGVDVAFDPSEPIPPYSERPDEIRARFRIA